MKIVHILYVKHNFRYLCWKENQQGGFWFVCVSFFCFKENIRVSTPKIFKTKEELFPPSSMLSIKKVVQKSGFHLEAELGKKYRLSSFFYTIQIFNNLDFW